MHSLLPPKFHASSCPQISEPVHFLEVSVGRRHSNIFCTKYIKAPVKASVNNGNGSVFPENDSLLENTSIEDLGLKRRKVKPKKSTVPGMNKEKFYGWKTIGEDPYRNVDGKKVYLDELDIIGFLDGYDALTPLDPASFNPAAYLWKKIAVIPEARRIRLFNLLESRHLTRMWELSDSRYLDESQFLEDATDMLPDVRSDEPLQPQIWDGRIGGLPSALGWLSDFQKVFFVGNDGGTYGYVISGGPLLKGPITSMAPLYFKVKAAYSLKVRQYERCDTSLTFTDGYVHLKESGLPPHSPTPKAPLWPFSNGMRDYLRAVGPGVLVGQSWIDGEFVDSTPLQFFGTYVLIKRA